ncbi:hypothetical protein VULLAG_LOCUS22984 [Vulpes lagopus]
MLPPGTRSARSRGHAHTGKQEAAPRAPRPEGAWDAGVRACPCVRRDGGAGRGAQGHGGPAPGLGPAVPGGTGSIADSRTAREPAEAPTPRQGLRHPSALRPAPGRHCPSRDSAEREAAFSQACA